jgi:hypothetical protein
MCFHGIERGVVGLGMGVGVFGVIIVVTIDRDTPTV